MCTSEEMPSLPPTSDCITEGRIRQAFGVMAAQADPVRGRGDFLDRETLTTVLAAQAEGGGGSPLSDADIQTMLEEVDSDNSGLVQLNLFIAWWSRNKELARPPVPVHYPDSGAAKFGFLSLGGGGGGGRKQRRRAVEIWNGYASGQGSPPANREAFRAAISDPLVGVIELHGSRQFTQDMLDHADVSVQDLQDMVRGSRIVLVFIAGPLRPVAQFIRAGLERRLPAQLDATASCEKGVFVSNHIQLASVHDIMAALDSDSGLEGLPWIDHGLDCPPGGKQKEGAFPPGGGRPCLRQAPGGPKINHWPGVSQ